MSETQVPAAPRLRIGLVGFGQAARMVLNSLTTYGEFDLVGAADTDEVVREAFTKLWGAPAFASVEELLDRGDLDAVYIATPTKFHEAHSLAALNAGVHVLVEKPMTLTIESAKTMIEAAGTSGKLLVENHKRSVDRPIITMWKLIHAGLLGDVRVVHRWHFSSWFYRPRAEEERDPNTGGIVLRQGAHEFDIIRTLIQSPPVKVWGWTADYDRLRPGEGSYQATVEFDNGVRATSIYSGYDHFDTNEFTAGLGDPMGIGRIWRQSSDLGSSVDEGALKRRTIEPFSPGNRSELNPFGFTLVNGSAADARPSPDGGVLLYGKDGREAYDLEGPAGTDLIAQEFHNAIAHGAPVLHDGRYGLAVLELCLAVRRSAALGGDPVTLSHQYPIADATVAGVIGDREPTLRND